jgi:hypothetical protein
VNPEDLQRRHDRAMGAVRARMGELLLGHHPPEPHALDALDAQRRDDVAALRDLGVLDDDPLYDDPRLLRRMAILPALRRNGSALLDTGPDLNPTALPLHGPVELEPLPCPGCEAAVLPTGASICVDVTPPACDRILEEYVIAGDEEVGFEFAQKRAVNNGHAQVAAYDPTVTSRVIHAVAVDDDGNLAMWKLDETGTLLFDEARRTPLYAVPGPPGFPTFVRFSFPAVADLGGGDILVGWLQEHADTLGNTVYQVCVAVVATASDLSAVGAVALAVSTASALAPAGWAEGSGGWKYLTAAGAAGRAVLAWTEWDNATLGSRQDVRARYAVFDGLYGATLQTMQFLTDNTRWLTRRSSDPSVAMDPTGQRAILIWEEEAEDPGGGVITLNVLGSPETLTAQKPYLWFMVLDTSSLGLPGVLAAGAVADTYGPVIGGDVGVACTEERVFFGNQLESGAVVMLRTNRWADLAVDEWTILSPPGGSSLGRGWLAGVSAWQIAPGFPTFAFVVWEFTKADLLDNDTKSVEVAFVDDTSGTFQISTRSFSPACGCVYFRLSPSGLISPSATGTASDPPLASVFWFEVHQAIWAATLRLRTYLWKGACLPISP